MPNSSLPAGAIERETTGEGTAERKVFGASRFAAGCSATTARLSSARMICSDSGRSNRAKNRKATRGFGKPTFPGSVHDVFDPFFKIATRAKSTGDLRHARTLSDAICTALKEPWHNVWQILEMPKRPRRRTTVLRRFESCVATTKPLGATNRLPSRSIPTNAANGLSSQMSQLVR